MEHVDKEIDGLWLVTIFAKRSTLDISQGF